jgi:hypothetical protein
VSAAPFTKFKMLQKFSKVNPTISGQRINMADDEVCLLSQNFGDLFQYEGTRQSAQPCGLEVYRSFGSK